MPWKKKKTSPSLTPLNTWWKSAPLLPALLLAEKALGLCLALTLQPGKPWRLIESVKHCDTNSLFNWLDPILSTVGIQMCTFHLLPGTVFFSPPRKYRICFQYLASFQYLPWITLPFLTVLRPKSRTGNVFMSWCTYMNFCIYYVNNDSQVLLAVLCGDSSQYVTQ